MRFLVVLLSALSLVLLVGITGPIEAQDNNSPQLQYFTETPEGWRAEIIPFPLSFAPTISYSGVEEVLFMPGMFRANAEDFFSYAFLWVVEGSDIPGAKKFETEVQLYYQGLQDAVLGEPGPNVIVTAVNSGNELENGEITKIRRHLTVNWLDPFVTKRPMKLRVLTELWHCKDADEWRALFKVVPVSSGYLQKLSSGRQLDTLKYQHCPVS
ncbi:MAG: hypothetical protein JKY60_16210 [Kordiimonadaceae bacterium]|nr:hypothetical protein [Kordiimonadaceae bacterium]